MPTALILSLLYPLNRMTFVSPMLPLLVMLLYMIMPILVNAIIRFCALPASCQMKCCARQRIDNSRGAPHVLIASVLTMVQH